MLHECDFVLAVLLQIAIKCFARRLSDRQSVRFELALESLAMPILKAAHSHPVNVLT